MQYARLHGWLVYHTYDSRRSEPGFPDLCMARRDRVVFAELKREGGQLTTEQALWLSVLAQTNAETYTWRPSDWPDIERTLQKVAGSTARVRQGK